MNLRSSIYISLHTLALLSVACNATTATRAHAASAIRATTIATKPTHKTAAANAATIDIRNFSFSPITITVAVGSSITWANHDSEPHTIASADNAFPASPGMDTDDHYTTVFKKPGIYKYFCTIHPSMIGTIVVK